MSHFKFSVCAFFAIIVVSSTLVSATESNELSKGVSQFASGLYEQCVKTKPGNVIISPLSVATSLALLSQATDGSTFDELQKGLHLGGDKSTIADQFHEYFGQLQRSVGDSTLSIVNQIYVKEGLKLNKNFQEVATTKFDSGVESLNFVDSEKSAKTINQFVEEKTNNKIHDLVKPRNFNVDTRAFLVNAIYFGSNWAKPFRKDLTRQEDFFISETESVQTEFLCSSMISPEQFNHADFLKDLEASALEMKYANSSLTFLIVLPNSRTGLPELEAKLKDYELTDITSQMNLVDVAVQIPKFKINYEIELNDVLKSLGIEQIFGGNADFDGFLETKEPLLVSKILHKASIEVSEEGTVAAAATGNTFVARMFPTIFQADHPFIYFIRDTETNTILFSGRFENVESHQKI